MIYSMTGYARKRNQSRLGQRRLGNPFGKPTLLRNHFRMLEQFRGLEPILRERFRKKLARGKVECNLRFEATPAANAELSINQALASQVIKAVECTSCR